MEVYDGVRGRNDTAFPDGTMNHHRHRDPNAKGGDDDNATTSTGVVRDPTGGVETHEGNYIAMSMVCQEVNGAGEGCHFEGE